jgi:hypothetical protein
MHLFVQLILESLRSAENNALQALWMALEMILCRLVKAWFDWLKHLPVAQKSAASSPVAAAKIFDCWLLGTDPQVTIRSPSG